MAVLYSNDFELETVGGVVSGFTTLIGSNFTAQTASTPANPARGAKGFGRNSNGDSCYWSGNTAITNTGMRTAQKLNTGVGSLISHLHRIGAGTDIFIRFKLEYSGGNMRISVEIRNNAAGALVSSGYSLAVVAGDVLHCETLSVGNVHEGRVWINSTTRPSSPTITLTDSTLSAGAAGLMKLGVFEASMTDDLVITDGAGGENLFYASAPGPTISVQPANQPVTAPATATFSVTAAASGGGTLSYQWQRNPAGAGTFANVATGTGGTTSSYTTAATTVSGGNANSTDTWRCIVTETGGTNAGSTTSSAATLTVSSASPTINTQPSAQTVTAPATATFTVTATTSGGALSYQWQRNTVAIAGATAASYTTPATTVSGGTANNGDAYRVLVTDTNGTTTSSAATLTVNAAAVVLTSSALKSNAGVSHLSAAFEAFVLNVTTGALIVHKTGLTSNATTGIVTFTDVTLTAATQYRVVWRRTDTGAQGIELLTAA